LKQIFEASADFLEARIIDEYFPIAKTILRQAHKQNFDSFSSKLKCLERNLDFLDFAFCSVSAGSERRKEKFTEMKENLKMMDFGKMPSSASKPVKSNVIDMASSVDLSSENQSSNLTSKSKLQKQLEKINC